MPSTTINDKKPAKPAAFKSVIYVENLVTISNGSLATTATNNSNTTSIAANSITNNNTFFVLFIIVFIINYLVILFSNY